MTEQGLLNRKPGTEDMEIVARSLIKITILVLFGAVSAFVFGYFLDLFFLGGTLKLLGYSVIGALIFLIISVLQVFFIGIPKFINPIILVESLALFGGLFDRIPLNYKYLLISFLIVYLILWWGKTSGRRILNDSLKINFWHVSRAVMPKSIVVVALMSSLIFAFNFSDGDLHKFLNPELIGKIITANSSLIKRFIPDFNLSSPSGEIIKKMAAKQIEEDERFKGLSPQLKSQAVNSVAAELQKKISDLVGEPVNLKYEPAELIYNALVNKYNSLSSQGKNIVLLAVGALIFLIIEGIAWPARVVISLIAYLIFEILFALRFAWFSAELRNKEFIVI